MTQSLNLMVSSTQLRVVHPSRNKRFNALNSQLFRWLAPQEIVSLFQFRKNCISVLCGDMLHFTAKRGKKAQYIFGIDRLNLRWLTASCGRHFPSSLNPNHKTAVFWANSASGVLAAAPAGTRTQADTTREAHPVGNTGSTSQDTKNG